MAKTLTVLLVGLAPVVSFFAFRGTVVLLLALALVGLWSERGRCLALPPLRLWLVLLAMLLAWAGLSALWAQAAGLALPKTASLVPLVLAGGIVLNYFRSMDPVMARRIVVALLIGLAATAVVAGIDGRTGAKVFRFVHDLGREPLAADRSYALPKAAATLCAIWGVICAAICWSWGWRGRAAVPVVAAAILVWSVSSNTGLLALAAGLGMFVVGAISAWLGRTLMAAAIIATFAAAPFASSLPDTMDIAMRFPWLPHSGLHRLAIWHFTGQRIDEHSILGWGMDGARSVPGGEDNSLVTLHYGGEPFNPDNNCLAKTTCVLAQQNLPLHPHNFALQVWLELGAVGAALFAAMLLAVMAAATRIEKWATAPFLATMTAVLVVASTAYGIWQAWWLASIWFTAAIGIAAFRVPTEATRQSS
ncbi:hypothetical protein [Paramagnetospirillum kuznetsovii]|nr:hypothetical protein [Paramagnetospirillum kuznetsovii]